MNLKENVQKYILGYYQVLAVTVRPIIKLYYVLEVYCRYYLYLLYEGCYLLTCNFHAADAEKQANGVLDAMRETGGETPENVLCQRTERVGSISKLQPKRTGRNRGKSSFSTNKRVQVPQSPIDESPARQERDGLDQNKERNNLLNKCSTVPSEHPLSTEKEIPQLSPFFWLREEAERSSQQTDVEQLTCTPAKAPSFSDLKDSDDDKPLDISAKVSTHSIMLVSKFQRRFRFNICADESQSSEDNKLLNCFRTLKGAAPPEIDNELFDASIFLFSLVISSGLLFVIYFFLSIFGYFSLSSNIFW